MERYAPTIKDLAPRDIVARCMVQEVAEGRGAGPHKDYVYLDCTHLGAEVLETKLPDITEFARTYLGVDPVYEPVPVMPTAHYAMGGIPTNIKAEVLQRQHHRRARPLRRRRVRLRLGARLEPPRHQLAARHQRVRQARRQQRRRVREDRRLHAAAGGPGRGVRDLLDELRDSTGTERIAVLRKELQDEMDRNAQVFRTDESLAEVTETIHGLRERYKNVVGAGQGQALQHRPARGRRARLPARPRRGRRLLGAQPQGEPRRSHARRLPEARRRELHEAHDGLPDRATRTRPTRPTTSGSTGSRSSITRYQPMERKY